MLEVCVHPVIDWLALQLLLVLFRKVTLVQKEVSEIGRNCLNLFLNAYISNVVVLRQKHIVFRKVCFIVRPLWAAALPAADIALLQLDSNVLWSFFF